MRKYTPVLVAVLAAGFAVTTHDGASTNTATECGHVWPRVHCDNDCGVGVVSAGTACCCPARAGARAGAACCGG